MMHVGLSKVDNCLRIIFPEKILKVAIGLNEYSSETSNLKYFFTSTGIILIKSVNIRTGDEGKSSVGSRVKVIKKKNTVLQKEKKD